MFDHIGDRAAHSLSNVVGPALEDSVTTLSEVFQRHVVESVPVQCEDVVVEDIDDDAGALDNNWISRAADNVPGTTSSW